MSSWDWLPNSICPMCDKKKKQVSKSIQKPASSQSYTPSALKKSPITNTLKKTYSEVGRLLGVAHSTIYDRIRKLEKNGIIKKWTVDVDFEKVGMNYITAQMIVYTDPKETESSWGCFEVSYFFA